MDSEYDYYDDDDYDDEDYDTFDDTVESDDGDPCGYAQSDDDDFSIKPQQKNYTILTVEDIGERQQKVINTISSVLSISSDSASTLLRSFNWDAEDAQAAWVDDTEKVCKDFGLLHIEDIKSLEANELICEICFDPYPLDNIKTTGCGHPFCDTCWKAYISISINEGPGCLSLKCPDPSCGIVVGVNMVNILASDEDREKYHHYLLRTYVEQNKKAKWCPAPGCDCAVEFDIGSENYDVSCKCQYAFCWNCTEEAHRPVACDTVKNWIAKNSGESENAIWILAHSKPCPKCNRPIQKNNGCMHMTCKPPCEYEFCWLCRHKWSEHGKGTGGFYNCNRYKAAKKEGVYDVTEHRIQMARKESKKYKFFYERWAENQSSRKKAIDDLNKMQTEHIAKFSKTQVLPKEYFEFIIDAWRQIIECRRLLKWTYAYRYYLDDEELAKIELFQFLQGQAEQCLEKLHLCAEKETFTLFNRKAPEDQIEDFRIKLVHLTCVTQSHFEKLTSGLENGLSEVDAYKPSSSNAVSSENLSQTSKEKKKEKKLKEKVKKKVGKWDCNRCVYENNIDAFLCRRCQAPRDAY